MKNILIYSDKLAGYKYGENHPFMPERSKHFYELLNRYSLIFENNQDIVEPIPLDENILLLFHEKEYIDLLKQCDKGEFTIEMLASGLGTEENPVRKGIYDFSITAAGGTYMGAMKLLEEDTRFVFNPTGGFHHAGKSHAEGFCYINDIAITITDLINKGKRVVYLDIDVHHGNGVQDAFYDNNKVLTISIHESGKTLYPWAGFENSIGIGDGKGYNINIPLLKGCDDDVYTNTFKSIVPPLIKNFSPDIVFAQIGADSHKDDPLAHLNLTSNGYIEIINIINELSPKIIATGGGGYNVFKTAALWTLAWAKFCRIEPEDYFAGIVGGMMFGPESQSGNLNDKPFTLIGKEKDDCMKFSEEIITYFKKNVFPIHGL